METWVQALGLAEPVWEQALDQVGWLHLLLLVLYFGAAWMCFINAHIARAARDSMEDPTLWYMAALALCVLGANTLAQFDVLLTQTLRSLARLDGWYAQRRLVQYMGLGGLALLLLLSWNRLHAAYGAAARDVAPMAPGLALLLLLLLLRTVSAHGTDAVLNLDLLGFSLARCLELGALGMVLLGTRRGLRLR